MFDAAAISLVNTIGQGMLSPNQYTINSAMEGRQYIYGFQLGASYKINEHFAVFAGARMNYFTGGYKGFLDINLKEGVAEQLGAEIVKTNGRRYDFRAGATGSITKVAAAE